MAKVAAKDGFIFHGWMVTELHLAGGDLFAFALVNHFSQSKAGVYTGGVTYLSSWTGWSRNTARKHLQRLVEMGLIEETRGVGDEGSFVAYTVVKNLPAGCANSAQGVVKNLPGGCAKIARGGGKKFTPDNKIENKDDSKEIVKDFVPPTVAQVREYADAHGFRSLDAEHFVEFYDSLGWKQKNGKHITSWKNAVITWKKRDLDKGIDIASPIKAAAPLHKSDRAYNDAETFLNSYNK